MDKVHIMYTVQFHNKKLTHFQQESFILDDSRFGLEVLIAHVVHGSHSPVCVSDGMRILLACLCLDRGASLRAA